MNDLEFCIEYLKCENHIKRSFAEVLDFNTFRALMNISIPYDFSEEYYKRQDNVLAAALKKKKITDVRDLTYKNRMCVWRGDITTLRADAIANACNEELLGCFSPLHSCIDNAIHSFAGLEVRRDLIPVMEAQGHPEENGSCKVTKGYNLPSSYIFHTVGPKAFGHVTKENENDLRSCYISCLRMAESMHLSSLVFPSISTGVYGYPIEEASKVAVGAVKEYLSANPDSSLKYVVFNVFSEGDYYVYRRRFEEIP